METENGVEVALEISNELSEKEFMMQAARETKMSLEKFERAKILEVYFSRLDGRLPENIPADFQDLYTADLNAIKKFLLGQHPQDALLHKIFKMMN